MKKSSTYSILKEIGDDALRKYIYKNVTESSFDSHRITNYFPKDFKDYYERMLATLADKGDVKIRNVAIANLIGIYLGQNRRVLQIEKVGINKSQNMNGEESTTSLWRKTVSI